MLVGKLRLLMTMFPSFLYLMLVESATRAVVTLGMFAISSVSAPMSLPNSRRESMMIGSHSSQFSPYSFQSVMNSFNALRSIIVSGPVPALSQCASCDVSVLLCVLRRRRPLVRLSGCRFRNSRRWIGCSCLVHLPNQSQVPVVAGGGP